MALDYYTVSGRDGRLQTLVVEEFVLREDFTAAGIDCAGFDGVWWSSADFSLRLRTDAACTTPVSRSGAETAFRELGGSRLPADSLLRDRFADRAVFPDVSPLWFGPDDGRRVYRLLFSGDLDERHLAGLVASLHLSPVDDRGVAGRSVTEHGTCELRRVGGFAWSIDLTFPGASAEIGPLVGVAMQTARGHGLIPVTVERFA
jgi:hypothetical protein